jgi:hypothetical protein
MINIEPTTEHAPPYDLDAEVPATDRDKIAVAANTAALIEQLGGSLDFSAADEQKAQELIKGTQRVTKTVTKPGVAIKLAALMSQYDHQVIADAQQARTFITNRLVELCACGDPKIEIKALELLGKHSDIGLFTERSEVTVHYKSSTDIEDAIKERVKRLLHSETIDVAPIDDLDTHLGTPNIRKNNEGSVEELVDATDTE